MAAVRFKAPEFKYEGKRQAELNFHSAIAAGAHLTLMTSPIPYPFRILEAKMFFPEEANNLVQHRWYTSRTRSAPTTGPPADTNIFGRENPTASFIGKSLVRVVQADVEITQTRRRIKLYTFNGCAYAYTLNASIIIEEL